jgi:hypothetical protein
MYVCMYVCVYCVYMYICMYVCMYVCMYLCMYLCMYVCMYVLDSSGWMRSLCASASFFVFFNRKILGIQSYYANNGCNDLARGSPFSFYFSFGRGRVMWLGNGYKIRRNDETGETGEGRDYVLAITLLPHAPYL